MHHYIIRYCLEDPLSIDPPCLITQFAVVVNASTLAYVCRSSVVSYTESSRSQLCRAILYSDLVTESLFFVVQCLIILS